MMAAFLAMPVLADAQSADFSGVQLFWRIAAELRRDVDPPKAAWDSLFATPGYAALEARERRRSALTTGFRAAMMPSRAAERDSILATNSWTARVIRHVQPLPARRAALDAFMARLRRDDIVGRAVARASTLLPARSRRTVVRPSRSFSFFPTVAVIQDSSSPTSSERAPNPTLFHSSPTRPRISTMRSCRARISRATR